jgi:hypothetical protein
VILRAVFALAGLALLLLSGGLAIWVAITLRDARRKVWATTSGVVTDSKVVPNRRCNGLPGHHYRVAYEFSIGGDEYRGTRVRSGDFRYMTHRAASRTAERYVTGSPVRVHYDPAFVPDHPDRQPVAVLEPGFNAECLYPVGVFAASLALAVFCFAMAVRS